MKFAIPLALVVAGAGCGPGASGPAVSRDELLRHEIAGSWEFANGHGLVTIGPNGTFSTLATNKSKTFAYKGTWAISNGDLLICLSESSEPMVEPVGQTNRLKILELSSTTLVHFDPLLDQTNIFHRRL